MLNSQMMLNRDKRIFKSVMGTELNVTYRPYILNILTSEYIRLQTQAAQSIQEYMALGDKAKVEDVENFQDKTRQFTDCGIKIILATLKANGQTATEEWLQDNISLDEFDLLVNYIIGNISDQPDTKKKNK